MAGFFNTDAAGNRVDAPESYESIQRKRKLVEALMKDGTSTAPVGHWTQGAARLAQALAGTMQEKELDAKEAATNKAFRDDLMSAWTGGGAVSTTQPASAPSLSMASDGQPAPVPPGNIPAGPLTDAIQTAAAKNGIDPAYLTRTAQLESSYGKNLQSPLSSAGGPFAFTNGTARQYGLADKNDPNASADAAARLALDNKRSLVSALGRDPSNQELYLAHQQGAGGARALLSNPQANVVDALLPIYKGDRNRALEAIRNNGGSPNMTAGQFAGKWISKFGGSSAAQPAVQTTSAAQLGAVGYAPETGSMIAPEAAAAIARASQPGQGGLSRIPDSAVVPPAPGVPVASRDANGALSYSQPGISPQPDPNAPQIAANAGPAQTQPDPILAATAARAANPQPGDQRIQLGPNGALPPNLQRLLGALEGSPEASRLTEGQPNASVPASDTNPGIASALRKSALATADQKAAPAYGPGTGTVRDSIDRAFATVDQPAAAPASASIASATPAASASQGGPSAPSAPPTQPNSANAAPRAPAGAGAANAKSATPPAISDRSKALLVMALNPALSPAQRQMAASAMTALQAQDKVSTIDLGSSIGVLDAHGNIVRQIPKEAAPKWEKLNDGTLYDSRTGETRAANGGPAFRALVDPAERARFGIPATDTKPYQIGADGKLSAVGGNGTNVNVETKTESAFEQSIARSQAELFTGVATDGMTAKGDLANIQSLRQNISKLPGGFLGGAQAIAKDYGINIGPNTSNLEAAKAILNKLVPAQRQGMPGAASDRDVQMFKDALPKLSNTPDGNKIIIDTMEALTRHKMAAGEIANRVMTGEMTRKDAMRALQELPDPMAMFKEAQKLTGSPGAATRTTPPSGQFSPDEIAAEIARRGIK
jgi:hypothetical protein